MHKVLENSTIDATKSAVKFDILVRKGVVDDWKNHFNIAESDLVDEKVRQLWTGIGLENLWAEDMKW